MPRSPHRRPDDSGDEAHCALSRPTPPLSRVDVDAVLRAESLASPKHDLEALEREAGRAEASLAELRGRFFESMASVKDALAQPTKALESTRPPPLYIPPSQGAVNEGSPGMVTSPGSRPLSSMELPHDLSAPWHAFGQAVDPLAPVTACGCTALHVVCGQGQFQAALGLLDKLLSQGRGSLVDPTNDKGATPLHWAATNGHGDIVALLLTRGANRDATTVLGLTAHFMAVQRGHSGVVRMLAACDTPANTRASAVGHSEEGGALLPMVHEGVAEKEEEEAKEHADGGSDERRQKLEADEDDEPLPLAQYLVLL